MTNDRRPTNRLDLLKLIADMCATGLPDPAEHPGFQPMLLTSTSFDEMRRWLEGFWSGYEEGRTRMLAKLMDETHQRRRADIVQVKVHAIAEAQRIVHRPRPIFDSEGFEYT